MLFALRDYIQRHELVSMEQLVREFHTTSDALEPMISILIQKGYIQLVDDKKNCGTTCRSCQPKPNTYYAWCKNKYRV